VLLSGGIDSATALCLTKRTHTVRAITFEYHGVARRELEAARAVANKLGVVEHRVVRLPDLKEAADIPGFDRGMLPPTYIPLRNSVFYSLAASVAEESGAELIVGGHNKDDAKIFHDVSSKFFAAQQAAFRAASPVLRRNRVSISRPLRLKTKVQVIALANELRVPFELTWSCHREGMKHCWSCPGCVSRRESFAKAGVADPLSPKW